MAEINGEEFDDFLVECVCIDPDNLNAEYERVPADMAYWSRQHANAEHEYLAAKANIKRAEGSAYERAMQALNDDYDAGALPKKPTEKMVDARASLDAAVEDAYDRLAKAARWRKEVEGYVEAISAKRDMLVSLGADLRKERETEPYIRDR